MSGDGARGEEVVSSVESNSSNLQANLHEPSATPFSCEGSADALARKIETALAEMGVQATTEFAVAGACAVRSEACPHTGEPRCQCQLTLLTIRGFPFSAPILFRIHSVDGQATLCLDQPPDGDESALLTAMLTAALAE